MVWTTARDTPKRTWPPFCPLTLPSSLLPGGLGFAASFLQCSLFSPLCGMPQMSPQRGCPSLPCRCCSPPAVPLDYLTLLYFLEKLLSEITVFVTRFFLSLPTAQTLLAAHPLSIFLFHLPKGACFVQTTFPRCYGLNSVTLSPHPPNSYVEVPMPSTSECDCIWRSGL